MFSKFRLFILLAITISLLAAGTAAMASGILSPIDKSGFADAVDAGNIWTVAHLTLPPPFVTYVYKVEPPSDRPVAVLGAASAKSAEADSAFYSDLSTESPDQGDEVTLTILSSIKYTSANGDILVTTAKPSVAAAAKSLFLGQREIKLINGVTAWASEYSGVEFPNRVIFVDGDLIITVASSLPINDVQNLAADIVLVQP